jgi:hypothetical protein
VDPSLFIDLPSSLGRLRRLGAAETPATFAGRFNCEEMSAVISGSSSADDGTSCTGRSMMPPPPPPESFKSRVRAAAAAAAAADAVPEVPTARRLRRTDPRDAHPWTV